MKMIVLRFFFFLISFGGYIQLYSHLITSTTLLSDISLRSQSEGQFKLEASSNSCRWKI